MTENNQRPNESLENQLRDDIDPRWNQPATTGDLRNVLVRIDSRFDSLRTYIDARFVGIEQRFVSIEQRFVSIEQRFSKTERLHQIEIVMIVIGFLAIIIKPMV